MVITCIFKPQNIIVYATYRKLNIKIKDFPGLSSAKFSIFQDHSILLVSDFNIEAQNWECFKEDTL